MDGWIDLAVMDEKDLLEKNPAAPAIIIKNADR